MFNIANLLRRVETRRLVPKRVNAEKSQAISELAILGALILAAFAVILSYIQSMNTQQSLQMRAFRKALDSSRSSNREVSYTIVKDSPVIDIKDIFGRPDTSRQVASSTVVAIRRDPLFVDPEESSDRPSLEIYEIDGQVYEIRPIKVMVQYEEDYRSWVPAPISDVEHITQKQRTGSLSKSEGSSSISTTRSSNVTVEDTTNLILEDRAFFERDYLEDLQDEVEQEPWEKRIQIERLSRRLAFTVEFIATGVLGSSSVSAELIKLVMQLFGLTSSPVGGAYNCPGGAFTVQTVMMGGAVILLSEVFSYLVNRSSTDGEARSVSIEEGYRAMDSISGTTNFSVPSSTFSVSQ